MTLRLLKALNESTFRVLKLRHVQPETPEYKRLSCILLHGGRNQIVSNGKMYVQLKSLFAGKPQVIYEIEQWTSN